MSYSDDEFGTDGGENDNSKDTSGGGGLRKQLEAALAERKQLADELTELRAFKEAQETRAVFEKLNVPAKIAKLYTADDRSEEAVQKWLTEYGDVFGLTQEGEGDEKRAEQESILHGTRTAEPPPAAQSREAVEQIGRQLLSSPRSSGGGDQAALDALKQMGFK